MRRNRSGFPRIHALFFFVLVSAAIPAGAQNEVLHSEILGEDRILAIRFPQSYGTSDTHYPVLYVLDAEHRPSLDAAVATVASSAAEGTSPEMIVIGIFNKNRNRDMIPVVVDRKPGSGGSGEFLQFIADELIPFVDERYRTNSSNLVYGGSNSGLFAVYALLERPDIFKAAIAASPMIGHCPDYMYGVADNLYDSVAFEGRFLFMIYGDDDYEGCTDYVGGFADYIKAKEVPGFRSDLIVVKGGGHVPDVSLHEGLEYVFSLER